MVMAPRGVGTMVTMIAAGKLMRVVDPRKLVVLGLLLTALSLWMMTSFTPQMDATIIITSGLVQGFGLGFVFVPLTAVAFATLDPRYRGDATSLFSLVRNIGSSIGISIVTLLLTRNVQINHAELSTAISPFNPNLTALLPPGSLGSTGLLMQLDGMVNIQALMISYVNDFKAMMLVTLAAIPLALLLRKPGIATAPAPAHPD